MLGPLPLLLKKAAVSKGAPKYTCALACTLSSVVHVGIEESWTKHKFYLYAHTRHISGINQIIMCLLHLQLERDMIAWNNKSYALKPLLVREDELILRHRRWFSQFYSKNSPRFSFKKEDLSFWGIDLTGALHVTSESWYVRTLHIFFVHLV